MRPLDSPVRVSGWDRAFSRSIPASGDRSGGSGEAERPWLALHRAQDAALDEYDRRHGLPGAAPPERDHGDLDWDKPIICSYVEHDAPAGSGGVTTECHYCRLAALASVMGEGTMANDVHAMDDLAEHLGVPDGTLVDPIVAFRACAELADDVAVLRALDRWEASRA